MARFVRFVVRNWPLKLAALGLSFVFYAGLVVSQGVRVWPGPIPIEPINQPSGAFLLEPLGNVTEVRFSALGEIAARVSAADFRATVDLREIKPQRGGAPSPVPVRVTASDPRIQVIDYRPQQVAVRLDPVIERTVPVFVDHGPVPEGLVLGQADVGSSTTATVRGASSLVQRVRQAVARVSIDSSAINVDADVPLIAVDDANQVVQPVDIEPSSVHVGIRVTRQRSTRSLPVVPVLGGTLPPGYETRGVRLTPPVVTVSGDEPVLGGLDTVPTEPIPLDGRTAPFSVEVALDLPGGVSAVDRARVTVAVEIAPQRASRSFEVGLTLTGARPDRTYRLGSTTVLVTLGGEFSTLDGVDPASLTATLDVRSLDTGTRDVAVSLAAPAGTTIVSLSPPRIEVVVGATSSPTPYARR